MTDRRNFALVAAMTVGGLLIWAVHFLTVYGFTGLACARGFAGARVLDIGVVPFTIGAATALALGGAITILSLAARGMRRAQSTPSRFLWYASLMLAGFAAIAIVWAGLPALYIDACR